MNANVSATQAATEAGSRNQSAKICKIRATLLRTVLVDGLPKIVFLRTVRSSSLGRVRTPAPG